MDDDPLELIRRSAYAPETLEKMGRAFDLAWSTVSNRIPPDEAPAARLRLARTILKLANDGLDVEAMAATAVAGAF